MCGVIRKKLLTSQDTFDVVLNENAVCMIEKIPPKGVILSDLIAIFVMSVAGSFIFLSNTKISEFCDMTNT